MVIASGTCTCPPLSDWRYVVRAVTLAAFADIFYSTIRVCIWLCVVVNEHIKGSPIVSLHGGQCIVSPALKYLVSSASPYWPITLRCQRWRAKSIGSNCLLFQFCRPAIPLDTRRWIGMTFEGRTLSMGWNEPSAGWRSAVLQSQKAGTSYFSSKQLLRFGFARQRTSWQSGVLLYGGMTDIKSPGAVIWSPVKWLL